MSRLERQPGERIDRERSVHFTFDGAPVNGLAGDTIASALFAAGTRTFSRSFKYHRRRGLLCCAGQCANCLVCVDGAPGVRACTEPLREGMRVEHLNATPSLEHDLMALTDRLGSLTPPGFYYKTFIRPRRLWPLYERVLRHAAGLGRLPKAQAQRRWRTEYRRRHADVLVIGGGLAGLASALAAAERGADVVLADEGLLPGGRALWESGHERAATLTEQVRRAGVEVLCSASALGFYDGLVAVWQQDILHQIRARQHVLATGAIEQPLLFAGNDLPGVMLSGGVLRLAALYGVRPGRRAVVVTVGDRGVHAAQALAALGVEIRALVDLRPDPTPASAAVEATERCNGWMVLAASGRRGVERVRLGALENPDVTRDMACDLLVVCGGEAPASSLLSQGGGSTAYDAARGHFRVAHVPDGMLVCGQLAGHADAERSGTLAGLRAARALGPHDEDNLTDVRDHGEPDLEPLSPVAQPPALATAGRGKCFACLCEDVTAKDIAVSIAEGYDSIELSKRYTTVTMGPCQGRMCQLGSARIIAEHTGAELARIGTTTARPPWSTVPLGALAGRPFQPTKRSPLHARHLDAGARVQWAGDWQRAYDYGDIDGEVLAVGDGAGLIDVSPLGKLLVRGPDAGAFLDRLYPDRLSNLAVGRIRYGLLTGETGRIMDDGTVCRLDEETFYVTTTSSGAGMVEQWFSWWLAEWELDVDLDDVTQGVGAINLAGPRSRSIISTLTDADCSREALPYLTSVQAHVAGVPCLMLRIGFVGELGYEIHCPSPHCETLWDALSEAGADAGVRPVGLEPQRVLRLQKLHLIVGQDTDSESTPYGTGMSWAVKLDKDDFVGRSALRTPREGERKLVGFSIDRTTAPTEGAVVIDDAEREAGQITSARYSPRLRRVIGLALVDEELAEDGTTLVIVDAGARLSAQVNRRPFHDPKGERLRS